MDLITLAMAKAYMDKNGVPLEKNTVLDETTVPVVDGVCRIAFAYGIEAGYHTVRVNGEEYGIYYHAGNGSCEEEKVYINLEKDYVAITFDPHRYDPESVPEYATVSVTTESMPFYYLPGWMMPNVVALGDIGNKIMQLCAEGGGAESIENVHGFWLSLSDYRYSNTFLIISADGADLVIEGASRAFSEDDCTQVGFTFAAAYGGYTFAAWVVIERLIGSENGANVTVTML